MDFAASTWLCGFGCAAAVMFAAHSPRDGRWEAVSLACLMFVNWGLFVLAYTDWSPKLALDHVGVATSSIYLWMLADAICGSVAIMLAFRHWWGFALWGVSVMQIGFHAAMDMEVLDPVVYVDVLLNGAFLVQLAIFFVIGGRGCVDRLHRTIARLRVFRRSLRTSAARTENP